MSLSITPLDFSAAFVEGLLLALSPCILSILPIVLSTSLEGGKWRPIGVILGLLISFIIFSLLLGRTFNLIGLRPEVIRLIANVIIVIFALFMLLSSVSNKLEEICLPLTRFGNSLINSLHQLKTPHGIISGLLIGSCLGLIWTPCIGPILGVAVAQAAAQVSIWHNLLLIGCFSIGVAFPMLLVVFFGKRLVDSLSFFKNNSLILRQAMGSIVLFSVIFTSTPSIHFAYSWFKASVLNDKQSQIHLDLTRPQGLQIGCRLNI